MSDVALKPCPFCGADAAWETENDHIECGRCSAGAGPASPAPSYASWNYRPIEDALRAEIAEAEARGRAAERAEIVALVRERAEHRRSQVEDARAGRGYWQAVEAKAGECEAIADSIERRGGGAA